MKRARSLIFLLGLALAASAAGQDRNPYDGDLVFDDAESTAVPTRKPWTADQVLAAEKQLARFASPTLTRFSGEEEFARYVEAVKSVGRAHGRWWASRPVHFAQAGADAGVQSDAVAPVCDRGDLECPLPEEADSGGEAIMVTGARIAARNASITNNQMAGVEEGDIVKQIDHYLLILQDGRIFVVDIRAGGRRLALTDRVDVYRNPKSDMWYDEMLVFGDRILVAGYSYDEEETELAVFRLGAGGKLAREGVFRLSSNDYYSSNNYSTRLIGDRLVTYTPLSVTDMARSGFQWPILRRWLPDAKADGEARSARRGRPLLDAASIYRPVRTTFEPTIHTVSVCPLAAAGAADIACRTTAVVGPPAVQWYVTDEQVFLWTAAADDDLGERDDCEAEVSGALSDAVPALLYRVPVAGGVPAVAGARGAPPDHFAMQADRDRIHALLRMESALCYEGYYAPRRLNFFSLDLARMGSTLTEAPDSAFTELPSIDSAFIVSRFTDRHLVYGGLSRYRRGPPVIRRHFDEDHIRQLRAEPRQPAYALPVARPGEVQPLAVRHSVIRAERVADDIVLTGYRDREGLVVSLISLDRAIGIASQLELAGRYESEGRSHAFNSLVEEGGSGLLGLPTVPRIADSGREYWRSRASDLSFLRLARGGRLSHLGEIERRFDYVEEDADGEQDEDGVPGYKCEVSCVDWYGNSRPIFTDGRIFALMGTEIVEGRVAGDDVLEVQRLNIALAGQPRLER